jgi:class 3 adenylate cyclase
VLVRAVTSTKFASPETYTPKHLAEKIRTSKTALEGERKQVTALFADMKGSMELLAGAPVIWSWRRCISPMVSR